MRKYPWWTPKAVEEEENNSWLFKGKITFTWGEKANIVKGVSHSEDQDELWLCPTEVKLDVSGPIRSVKCAIVFNVLCKGSQCIVELCPAWPIWSRDLSPSTQGILPSPLSGHWEFSLLADPKKDESGQCREHSQAAQSGTTSYRTVYVHIFLYFSSINTVFWNIPQMVHLHSTDCCYFLGLINHIME